VPQSTAASGATSNDGAREIAAGQLAVLSEGDALSALAGDASARFLLLAAQPLREPIARYGPFVMNTREEIAKAVEDYQRGTLIG
jgi:redox-sensitive bicupin YhaK (pirin superfamily)